MDVRSVVGIASIPIRSVMAAGSGNIHRKNFMPRLVLMSFISLPQMEVLLFGGGEPCLRPDFIRRFREQCGCDWRINLETSLNVPSENIKSLLPIVDTLIIDVKDINPAVYCDYTGSDNVRVVDNLKLIADQARQMDCVVRLPLIPGYNNDADRISSRAVIEALGFTRFDLFTYQIRKH